ncbi:protein FRG2-like-2 [Acomys russatus]|uniref:protein FRG2-like-2 n=1 Tax=Acomys russatus TaxID=60746 RepID=UPI0021E2D5CD|nr:protein FRG2-like-2 [Acomys russatus]
MESGSPHPERSPQPLRKSSSPKRTCARRSPAQMMEKPRKRKHCSRDSSHDRTGNEDSFKRKKRPKSSVEKSEPKANGHHGGPSCCSEPRHTAPPPLRKSLVTSMRAMSEDIYRDTVQLQAQLHGSLLTQEQVSELTQLSASLRGMVQTLYSLATQAGFVFPAEPWLVPAPMAAPWELPEKESHSPSLDGGEKLTGPASPSDKS